ncbi:MULTISPECIES: hypothetical protein [Acinetobacter]|nr:MULTISPECIES: hypothetical protein [Acinetobacter]
MKNQMFTLDNIHGLPQLCPTHSSIAFCLNQLRQAHIVFFNLGNIIICPEQKIMMIFKEKYLSHMEKIYLFP